MKLIPKIIFLFHATFVFGVFADPVITVKEVKLSGRMNAFLESHAQSEFKASNHPICAVLVETISGEKTLRFGKGKCESKKVAGGNENVASIVKMISTDKQIIVDGISLLKADPEDREARELCQSGGGCFRIFSDSIATDKQEIGAIHVRPRIPGESFDTSELELCIGEYAKVCRIKMKKISSDESNVLAIFDGTRYVLQFTASAVLGNEVKGEYADRKLNLNDLPCVAVVKNNQAKTDSLQIGYLSSKKLFASGIRECILTKTLSISRSILGEQLTVTPDLKIEWFNSRLEIPVTIGRLQKNRHHSLLEVQSLCSGEFREVCRPRIQSDPSRADFGRLQGIQMTWEVGTRGWN